jgi:hypothetical protein
MPQPTYQPSFILSFENKTNAEIPKHRFVSYNVDATTLANLYPTANTGIVLGVTVDNVDAKQTINVQRGGVVLIELETNTTLTAGTALKVGANGLGRKHSGTDPIVAYALDAVTSSVAGQKIRAVLA